MSRPKSNARKALSGTLRPCRTREESPPATGLADLDDFGLSDRARRFVGHFVEVVDASKLSAENTPAFVDMVEHYADMVALRETLAREGSFIESTNERTGSRIVRPHPAAAMLNASAKVFQRYADAFAMLPTARLKAESLAPPPAENRNPFADI